MSGIHEDWARALTDEKLASELNHLAGDIRFHSTYTRRALLMEAARRLTKED